MKMVGEEFFSEEKILAQSFFGEIFLGLPWVLVSFKVSCNTKQSVLANASVLIF